MRTAVPLLLCLLLYAAPAAPLDAAEPFPAWGASPGEVLDMRRPNMQPVNAVVKNIVYSGSTSNIRLTMIDGRILYENGSFFVGESADAIYEKANAIINRMRG